MLISEFQFRQFVQDWWGDFDVVRDRLAALRVRDPEAFGRVKEHAWTVRDTKSTLAIADILDERGELGPEDALNAGIALLQHNQPQRALEMLTHPVLASGARKKLGYHQARAHAANGRFVDALEAIERFLTRRPDLPEGMDMLRLLARTIVLRSKVEVAPNWSLVAQLMENYVTLSAWDQAVELHLAALALPPALGGQDVHDMCAVLRAGLDVKANLGAMADFLAAAGTAAADNGQIAALRLRTDTLLGRPIAPGTQDVPKAVRDDRDWRFSEALAYEAAGETETATDLLGRLAFEYQNDQEARSALARCVGAGVLRSVDPQFGRSAKSKIFNVFPFSDELTLLRMRLEEMADWVDHFVLVEATTTFAGAAKPLHYLEHAGEFAAFASKIIHVPLRAFPDHINTPWARDFYQRDWAISALSGLCGEDDQVYITDVDEIVDRRAVKDFDGVFAGLHMKTYRYFLNYRQGSRHQGRTGAVWRAKHLRKYGLSYARFVLSRQSKDWCRILDSGWHFTSVGEAAQIAQKYQNYAHQEHAGAKRTDTYEQMFLQIRDGQHQKGWSRCEIDDSFPEYIRRNQSALAQLII